MQQLDGLALGPLKRVAADDRPEAAAIRDAANLLDEAVVALGRPAREDDDTTAVEGALHDVPDPFGEGSDGDALGFVDMRAASCSM